MEIQLAPSGAMDLEVVVTPPCNWNPTALVNQPAILTFAPTISVINSNAGAPSLDVLAKQQIAVTLGPSLQFTNYGAPSNSDNPSIPPFGIPYCNCGLATSASTEGGCYSYIIKAIVVNPSTVMPITSSGGGYNIWDFAPGSGSCTLTVPGLSAIAA